MNQQQTKRRPNLRERLNALAAAKMKAYPEKFGPKDRGSSFHFVVREAEQDENVMKAFDAAGLNPRDMFHWWELLGLFADLHFSPSRLGRPLSRTEGVIAELRAQYEEIAARQRSPSMIQACRDLKRMRNDPRTPETLMRILQGEKIKSPRRRFKSTKHSGKGKRISAEHSIRR